MRSLRPSPRIGKPVGDLHGLQLGLPFQLGFLFFGRVRVALVSVQPLAENFDRMAREANTITLRAAGRIIASRGESAAGSAVQCFDARQLTRFSAGKLVDGV